MNVNAEKMEKQEMNLPYEQPILKKYGTMKVITQNGAFSGSLTGGGGGGGGGGNPDRSPVPSDRRMDDSNDALV